MPELHPLNQAAVILLGLINQSKDTFTYHEKLKLQDLLKKPELDGLIAKIKADKVSPIEAIIQLVPHVKYKWLSSLDGLTCDICETPLNRERTFYYTKTLLVPWDLCCPACSKTRGIKPFQKYHTQTRVCIGLG